MTYTADNPSPAYLSRLEWTKGFHQRKKLFTGQRVLQSYIAIKKLIDEYDAKTILDYGCGKGQQYDLRDIPMRMLGTIPSLAEGWGVTITGYDPAVPAYEKLPDWQFDGVICQDVLQYIPPSDTYWVIDQMFAKARGFVFARTGVNVSPKKRPPDEFWPDRLLEYWLEAFSRTAANYPTTHWHIGIKRKDEKLWDIWARDGAGARQVAIIYPDKSNDDA